MKTATSFLIVILFFTTTSHAQNTVEASLKKVITEQTEAIMNNDFGTWQTKWLHDDKVSFRNIDNNGEVSLLGWQKMSETVANMVKVRAKPKSFNIKNDSFIIRTDKSMASVQFDQVMTFTDSIEHKNFSHQSFVLIKQNNDWKIASMVVSHPKGFNSFEPSDIENTLNTTGYNLINGNRLDQAIEVFKLNVKLHPKAWNTYDSLGEAYALAGNKDLAIENYKMSIELNPANDNGKKALEKLMK